MKKSILSTILALYCFLCVSCKSESKVAADNLVVRRLGNVCVALFAEYNVGATMVVIPCPAEENTDACKGN